jgi:hypothetical protein
VVEAGKINHDFRAAQKTLGCQVCGLGLDYHAEYNRKQKRQHRTRVFVADCLGSQSDLRFQ